MYQELKPSAGLSSLIDTFWTFSTDKEFSNFKILPDTCTDLIFDLNQNQGFISGVMSSFQIQELPMGSDIIGIRFKSENFGSLSKAPLDKSKNLKHDLSDIFQINTLDRLKRLSDLESITNRLNYLEKCMASIFKENHHHQDHMVVSLAQNIRTLKGNVNIGNLVKSTHLSLRQIQRRFKSYVGLSIKEFSSIVRFNNAKNAIKSSPEKSLLEIAFDYGFFDHSHMNHEFNHISGEYPSLFR